MVRRVKVFKVISPHDEGDKGFVCKNCYLSLGKDRYAPHYRWKLFCHDGDNNDGRCTYSIGCVCRSGLGWENHVKRLKNKEANALRMKLILLGKEYLTPKEGDLWKLY